MKIGTPALRPVGRLVESNPFGSNWRSSNAAGSGDLGTGRVIRPDAPAIAQQWKSSGGKVKSEWEEYAKRIGVFDQDIETGWLSIYGPDLNSPPPEKELPKSSKPTSGPPIGSVVSKVTREEAISKLRTVMGEATSWMGYSVPNFHMLKTPQTPDTGGFGFHTVAAEKVWDAAKEVADEDPKESTLNIVQKACAKAQISSMEMTPEDNSLLDMAINWYLAGKAKGMETPVPPSNGNRMGGTPGGPFRSANVKGES